MKIKIKIKKRKKEKKGKTEEKKQKKRKICRWTNEEINRYYIDEENEEVKLSPAPRSN